MADLDLARRAVACPGWHPSRGMRGVDGSTILLWERGAVAGAASKMDSIGIFREVPVYDGWLPDLSDPATLGALLALVREAWGEPRLVAVPYEGGWWVDVPDHGGVGAPTEAAALVAALEAAPSKEVTRG